jgi:hypothetical protein
MVGSRRTVGRMRERSLYWWDGRVPVVRISRIYVGNKEDY